MCTYVLCRASRLMTHDRARAPSLFWDTRTPLFRRIFIDSFLRLTTACVRVPRTGTSTTTTDIYIYTNIYLATCFMRIPSSVWFERAPVVVLLWWSVIISHHHPHLHHHVFCHFCACCRAFAFVRGDREMFIAVVHFYSQFYFLSLLLLFPRRPRSVVRRFPHRPFTFSPCKAEWSPRVWRTTTVN